jgi:hypothetical protein
MCSYLESNIARTEHPLKATSRVELDVWKYVSNLPVQARWHKVNKRVIYVF